MTEAKQALLPVTPDEDRCDICCRPREQHVGRDLQCDTTTYFRPMPKQSHFLPGDVESVARALFVFQHQGDIADPGQVWDAPDKGLHPIYWTQKMEHNHPHYRAMARSALAALTPSPCPGDVGTLKPDDAVERSVAAYRAVNVPSEAKPRESDKPPVHWTPDVMSSRGIETAEEWDWRRDGPENNPLNRSWNRLRFAYVYADPHAPDQMATVLRIDLGRVLSRLTRALAQIEMKDAQIVALTPSSEACEHCGGAGEVFSHADDCSNDSCALNGDMDSCNGKVEACHSCSGDAGEGE